MRPNILVVHSKWDDQTRVYAITRTRKPSASQIYVESRRRHAEDEDLELSLPAPKLPEGTAHFQGRAYQVEDQGFLIWNHWNLDFTQVLAVTDVAHWMLTPVSTVPLQASSATAPESLPV